MKTTKPETSLTRELSINYDINENLSFKTVAYKGKVSDVLNRGTSTNGYNEIIDIKQEGLESNFEIGNKSQRLLLSSILSKSREGDGDPQQRRPEKQFGIKFNKKLKNNLIGPFNLNYNYRHIGKVEDWKEGTYLAKVDSSDIMDFSLSKEMLKNIISINITNLTDEKYQRPDTYNQDGRRISLSLKSKY